MDKIKNRNSMVYIFKTILVFVLFFGALYFENAQKERLYIFVAIFTFYMGMSVARMFISHECRLYYVSFLLDILFVYALEQNSRLLINYFFHSFYIIVLLEAALTLDMREGLIVGIAAVAVSMIKYIYLIYYKFNFSNISQMAFFLMANVLILVISGFGQYNKEEREKKDILYKELLDAHKQLKLYNNELNRLFVVKERNRIAREIHDSLGHNMTALIMQLQMVDYYIEDNHEKARELLLDSILTAKKSLSGIREVVETLGESDKNITYAENIKKLIYDFSKKTGADIKFKETGENEIRCHDADADLYRIIQESLTNAIRHEKATEIYVEIDYSDNSVKFFVKDNGVGMEDVVEGFGIKGIRERVKAFKGELEIISNEGFCIKGTLNLEGEDDKSVVS